MSDTILAFWTHIQNLKTDETGATAVEYGMLVALIAAFIIGTVGILGGKINGAFQEITAVL